MQTYRLDAGINVIEFRLVLMSSIISLGVELQGLAASFSRPSRSTL